MRKLSARWVPRLLTIDQKLTRMNIYQGCLDLFKRNPSEFLRRFITVDETWIHYYTPQTNSQNSGLDLEKVHQRRRKRLNL